MHAAGKDAHRTQKQGRELVLLFPASLVPSIPELHLVWGLPGLETVPQSHCCLFAKFESRIVL